MDNGSSNLINPSTGLPFGSETETGPVGRLTIDHFPPLAAREQEVLRQSAVASLQAGVHPEVGVAFPLQAMCQIVVLIDTLNRTVQELRTEIENVHYAGFELEPDRSNEADITRKVLDYLGGALRRLRDEDVDLRLRIRTRDTSTDEAVS
jgi:hypothetical protein